MDSPASCRVIAIDGKTLRHSCDTMNSKSAIQMVSAWATLNHIRTDTEG